MARLQIAVTAGEPAGIGPDLALSLAHRPADELDLVVLADPDLLSRRARQLGLKVELVNGPARPGQLQVRAVPLAEPCVAGVLNPANARYVLDTLEEALSGCRSGAFDAMVTAPVQKSVINDAGFVFPGHTEFLARATGTERAVMMLATERLRVALATTHLPLAAVPGAITAQDLAAICRVLCDGLRWRFGIPKPRIAVLGLNPHAGEAGHLGTEEIDIIIPTLEALREEGLDLRGPLPADTAFQEKILAHCDAVLAMYHDQGLPVLKYSGFGAAANITLGLPIVRTSVDHGTALDLAGTGQADNGSLLYAIRVAARMAAAGSQ